MSDLADRVETGLRLAEDLDRTFFVTPEHYTELARDWLRLREALERIAKVGRLPVLILGPDSKSAWTEASPNEQAVIAREALADPAAEEK